MKKPREQLYIYGRKPVEETLVNSPKNVLRIFISERAIATDPDIEEIKKKARDNRIPFNTVAEKKIGDYVGDVNDQGVVALLSGYQYQDFQEWLPTVLEQKDKLPAVLILDHIEDTHNYGAILRTALAVGVSAVIVAKDRQAPVNATVFKTSAGAASRIPVIQVANINQTIERLKENGFWSAAVDMAESKRDYVWEQEFTTPMVFVLGNEGKGVSHQTLSICDFIVSLPMTNDVESLNVSVAAAGILYEWKRQMLSDKK